MKKILMCLCMCMALRPAAATTMCAEDDVVAGALDPMINGTNHTSNSEIFEWSAVFPYGTVWGIATCVDTSGTTYGAVDELRDSNGEIATGGERTGRYCWCQMTHPLKSRWLFRHAGSSVAACGSSCADHCGLDVRDNSGLRAGVFGSVGD